MSTKLTDARMTALLTALENGCTRRAAAGAAGIHHATFYRWLDADATLRDAVEKAEDLAEAKFTAAVVAAVPRNWQAAARWLERRKHQDFGRRDALEVKMDLRAEATTLAEERGLDAAAAIAEAEALLRR